MMLSNCGAGEDSWESLGLQGDQTSQPWRKSTPNIHWKDWCWSWSTNILATWCEEPTQWKNTLMLGKIEGRSSRGRQKMGWLDSSTDSMHRSLRKFQETAKDREAWHTAAHGIAKNQTWLSNWTATNDVTLGKLLILSLSFLLWLFGMLMVLLENSNMFHRVVVLAVKIQ